MVILWLGLSVIPILYYVHLSQESHAFLVQNMISQARQFLSFVDEKASNQYAEDRKNFQRLGHSMLLKDFAKTNDPKLKEYITNQWMIAAENIKFFSQIRYIDNLGYEKIRIDHGKRNNESYFVSNNALEFIGDRDYFRHAQYLQEEEIGYSNLDIEYENGQPIIPYQPTFRLIYPIDDQGERLGYFIANLNVMRLISQITANTQQYKVDFVDSNGDFILSTDTSKLFGQLLEERAKYNLKHTHVDLWNSIEQTPLKNGYWLDEQELYVFRPFYTRLFETPGGLTLITTIPSSKIRTAFVNQDRNIRSDAIILWFLLGMIAWALASLWNTYQRNKLDQTFNQLAMDNTIAVAMTDADHRIVQVNSRFCQMVSKEPAELQNLFISDLQLSSAKFRVMTQKMNHQDQWTGELILQADESEMVCKVEVHAVMGIGKARHYVYSFSDISQQHKAMLDFKEQSERDPSTALWNKKKFNQTLVHYSRLQARYSDQPTSSLAIIDIDDFKQINDRYGHDIGDKVIIDLTTQLLSILRNTDFIARIGGDEFAVILQHADAHLAFNLMERICHAVAAWQEYPVTVSIGLAEITSSNQQTFINADQALYRSKNKGKNCVSAHGFESFSVVTNNS